MTDMMDKMLLGLNIFGDKITGIKYANSIGANFIQIFLKSPRSYVTNNITIEQLNKIKKQLIKYNCGCVVHSSYVINLARPPNNFQHFKGVEVIADDMTYAYKIGAIGAIIHMGKNVLKLSNEEAMNNFVIGIHSVLKKSHRKSVLILETAAGQGTEMCTTLKELGKLRKMVDKKLRHRVKFCIDTCHVFAAGYNIKKKIELKKFIDEINKYLGWKNVCVIHLNDSVKKCGERKDCHAVVGKGKIGFKPLMRFVKIASHIHNIPIVMEPPHNNDNCSCNCSGSCSDNCDIKQIKKIRKYFDEI
jgi:deoxyribonuclease-4